MRRCVTLLGITLLFSCTSRSDAPARKGEIAVRVALVPDASGSPWNLRVVTGLRLLVSSLPGGERLSFSSDTPEDGRCGPHPCSSSVVDLDGDGWPEFAIALPSTVLEVDAFEMRLFSAIPETPAFRLRATVIGAAGVLGEVEASTDDLGRLLRFRGTESRLVTLRIRCAREISCQSAVNRPPLLTAPDRVTLPAGGSVSFDVAALDPDGDDLRVRAEVPPGFEAHLSWQEASRTATVTAGPQDAGRRFAITFSADDDRAPPIQRETLVSIQGANTSPLFAPIGLVLAAEGTVTRVPLLVIDPDGDAPVIEWARPPPALRTGRVTLDDRMLVIQTGCDDAGVYELSLRAVDAQEAHLPAAARDPALIVTQTFPLLVFEVNCSPRFPPLPLPLLARPDERFVFHPGVTDPDGDPISVAAILEELPPGSDARLLVDPVRLEWTPRAADVRPAPWAFVLVATDGLGASAAQRYPVVVGGQPPADGGGPGCGSDEACPPASYCAEGACRDRLASGPCDRDRMCASGRCGEDRTCALACGRDAECPEGAYCDGTSCRRQEESGAPCARPEVCRTGTCRDGFCCASACDEPCRTCAGGTCAPVVAADDPDTCTGTRTCDADGACRLRQGERCETDAECATGHCADGRCCDSACVAACASCASGTCEPVRGSEDSPECAGDRACDAAGACRLRTGAPCEQAADCIDGFCSDGVCCDTACDDPCEACVAGRCTAVVDADDPDTCAGDRTCDAAGRCRKRLGERCEIGEECVSGACADSVCCAEPCTGTCRRCSASGTCMAVAGVEDPDTCAGVLACDLQGVCRLKRGEPCDDPGLCQTGHCVNGRCCETACSAGEYCAAAGTCSARKEAGAACVLDAECRSERCVQGACACTAHEHCGPGTFCADLGGGACEPCSRSDPLHCGTATSSPGCTRCTGDPPACVSGACLCVEDASCGAGRYCVGGSEPGGGQCVECGRDDPARCGGAGAPAGCTVCAGTAPDCRAGACGDFTPPVFAGLGEAAALGPYAIALGWSAASDNVTPPEEIEYDACLSTEPGGCLAGFAVAHSWRATTSGVANALRAGTTYYVVMRARDAAGNRDANEVERAVTTPGASVCDRGGWCWENPTPQGNALRALWRSPSGDLWAAGDKGTVLRFDGERWWSVPPGTGASLLAAWGDASSTWFAGGAGAAVRHGGEGWSSFSTGTSQSLTGLWGASASDLWAVGSVGTLRRWNGSAWGAAPGGSPTSASLNGAWGSAAGDVWAVGACGARLRWSGSAWTEPFLTTQRLRAVHGSSSTQVWAAGPAGALLRWNGTSWSSFPSGTTEQIHGIWVLSSSEAWAVGDNTTILRWNGSSWSAMSPKPTGSISLRAVWGTASNNVWVVGEGGAIWRWNGSSWADHSRTAGTSFYGVWTDGTDVWVVGTGGARWRYWRPSLSFTWQQYTSPSVSSTLRGVWGTSSSDVWAVGDGGSVLRWTGSWSTLSSPSGGNLQAVHGSSATNVWAVSSAGDILRWTGGPQWSASLAGEGLATSGLFGVFASSSSNAWAVGVCGLRQRWNGSTWSNIAATTQTLQSIHGSSATNAWAVGDAGSAILWNGSAWTAHASGTTSTLRAVWTSSATDAWAVGDSGIVRRWTGSAWTSGLSPDFRSLYAVSGGSPSELFVAGDLGMLARWTGSAWEPHSAIATSSDLRGVWAAAPDDAWAVGSNVLVRWDGFGWTASSTPHVLNAIWGASSTAAWAVGANETILRWDGDTWSVVSQSGRNIVFNDVHGSSGENVWAVASGSGTRAMHWNGAVWLDRSGSLSGDLSGVWVHSPTAVWAVGHAAGRGRLHRWDGEQWTQLASGDAGVRLQALWGLAPDDLFVVGEQGAIWRWHDNTFSRLSSPVSETLLRVWARSANEAWVSTAQGRLLRWDGVSWQVHETDASTPLYGLWGVAPASSWAVGGRGTILRRAP